MAAEIVRYRLPDWKKKHIHDAEKATKISETLEKAWLRNREGRSQWAHRLEVSLSRVEAT